MSQIKPTPSLFSKTLLLLVFGIAFFLPLRAQAAPADTDAAVKQYALIFQADYYAAANPDVAAALGTDPSVLLQHFLTAGMAEGRQGSPAFNVYAYAQNNPDLFLAFGSNLPAYYAHYMTNGYAEGRSAVSNPQSPQAGSAVPSGSTAQANADPTLQEVLNLVNRERQANGLNPLSFTEALNQAADIRAKEMEQLFSHTRPDGSSCFSVLKDLHISYRSAGENIASGYPSSDHVMNGWMNSPGHRSNILKGSFGHIGVGHYKNYWVQLFTN